MLQALLVLLVLLTTDNQVFMMANMILLAILIILLVLLLEQLQMKAFCRQKRILRTVGEGKVVADPGRQRKRARVLVKKVCSFCKKGALFGDREPPFFDREALFGDRKAFSRKASAQLCPRGVAKWLARFEICIKSSASSTIGRAIEDIGTTGNLLTVSVQ